MTTTGTLAPLTETTALLPLQRTTGEADAIVWSDTVTCTLNGETVDEITEHAHHCGDCFAHYCLEN